MFRGSYARGTQAVLLRSGFEVSDGGGEVLVGDVGSLEERWVEAWIGYGSKAG